MKTANQFVPLGLCLAAVLTLSSPAAAQGFLSGSIGTVFGGDTTDNTPVTYGGAAGVFGRMLGAEVDVTYTPDFFTDSNLVGENSITTVMGNVLAGPRLGAMHPYVTGGVGLMRLSIKGPGGFGEYTRNDLAMNAGGGVMVFLAPRVGLRGDLRYFRNLNDNAKEFGIDFDQFNYWRATAGVVVKF